MKGKLQTRAEKAEEEFDPTRALDGWQPRSHQDQPELDLAALRAAQGPALSPERVAELRRRGFSMRDVEDVNFSESDFDAADDSDFPDTIPMGLR